MMPSMASARTAAPLRTFTCHRCLSSIRHDALRVRQSNPSTTSFARTISVSTKSKASIYSIVPSPTDYAAITSFAQQTVLATIHHFPSLEPLRYDSYPVNHLNLPTRKDLLHRAIVYEGDKTRSGTANTKTRWEVRGSSRKLRPQKGSGRARLGDAKSPMLVGGGVAFGPKPRNFATGLQKKVYDLAWRTALSYRYRKGELIIVDNAIELESPSVQLLSDIFKYQEKLRGKGRSLLITLEERPLLKQVLGEMGRLEQAQTWEEVDVKNMLELSRIIIERDALHNILVSHQEDLTHMPLPPWSKEIRRSLSPTALELIPGWQEFRALALTPAKDRGAARADAFESAAGARYEHAQSLPEGLTRTELIASANNLLAEAKELHFEQRSGMQFAAYADLPEREDPAAQFPRIQALQYQINVKQNRSEDNVQTSQPEAEPINLEIFQLEAQKLEIALDAAVLAAQVYEHRAKAQELLGHEEQSELTMDLASAQRTTEETCEMALLEKKIEIAQQKSIVARLKRNKKAIEEAVEEERIISEQLEARRAEIAAFEAEFGEEAAGRVEEVQHRRMGLDLEVIGDDVVVKNPAKQQDLEAKVERRENDASKAKR